MEYNPNLEMSKGTTFNILSEQRKVITALHEQLGKWLIQHDRYSQMAADFYREEVELVSIASNLIQDVEVFIDKSKNITLKDGGLPSDSFESSSINTFAHKPDKINLDSVDQDTENTQSIGNLELREDNLLNKNLLKGLTMFEALKKYLAMFSKKQTVKMIVDGLTDYGFEADIKHLYEGVRGMLRYYEKRGFFERDKAYWGLAKEEVKPAIIEIEKPIRAPSVTLTNTGTPDVEKPPPDKLTTQETKTNPEYCKEILQRSGQPWLHVDQILVCLKKDYGIIRNKEIIAAALRKNSNNKRRVFKTFGGNRFGLLEDQPTVAKNISN